MENVYVLIAFIAAMVMIVGAVLIWFLSFMEKLNDRRRAYIVAEDLIPRVEEMTTDMVDKMIKSCFKETKNMIVELQEMANE